MTLQFNTGTSGQTVEARLRLLGAEAIAQTVTLTEIASTGWYSGTPGNALAAGQYWIELLIDGVVSELDASMYHWDGAQEITLSTIAATVGLTAGQADQLTSVADLVSAGALTAAALANVPVYDDTVLANAIAAIPTDPLLADTFDALLTGDNLAFNTNALKFAPTGSTGGGLTSGQADQLTSVADLVDAGAFTAAALINAPTSLVGSVDLSPLDPKFEAILSQATLARQTQTNSSAIDLNTAIVTIYADDGVTPVNRFRLTDALGNPSVNQATKREKL